MSDHPGEDLLWRAREALGLTQGQVAKAAGVSVSSVSDAELAGMNASLRRLDRYGRAMGLELIVAYRRPDGQLIE